MGYRAARRRRRPAPIATTAVVAAAAIAAGTLDPLADGVSASADSQQGEDAYGDFFRKIGFRDHNQQQADRHDKRENQKLKARHAGSATGRTFFFQEERDINLAAGDGG